MRRWNRVLLPFVIVAVLFEASLIDTAVSIKGSAPGVRTILITIVVSLIVASMMAIPGNLRAAREKMAVHHRATRLQTTFPLFVGGGGAAGGRRVPPRHQGEPPPGDQEPQFVGRFLVV